MSTSYSAVGWNRQKKIYDSWIGIICITYLIVFTTGTALLNPDYTFETLLIRSTATLAILLLHLILSIGPLTRINPAFLPLLYNRRHLGVTMFFIAAIHGGFSFFQFHALGNVNPFVSLLTSNTRFFSIPAFPFQLLGFTALVIFFMMAITSHDFWLHNLSPRIWKTLHMFVYLAYFLILLHVVLGVIQYETHPVLILILGAGACWLLALHLVSARKERLLDKHKFEIAKEEGYVQVCNASDILDGRAKIFCIDKERIAVYKTENRFYAIHNVCKHQGGPLGEGRILDGCITCPWHGYQYLPHNGQSPPPFKEKVSTYAVRNINGAIWINPRPYPEGTSQEGAVI